MNLITRHTLRAAALSMLLPLLTSNTFGQIPGVIGIKLGFTGGYATSTSLAPTDQAGVVAVTNWNNLLASLPSGASASQRIAAEDLTWNIAQDSAGHALSGMTLTAAGWDDGWYTGGTECPEGRLLYDVWKVDTGNESAFGNTYEDGAGKYYATLSIANLPANSYDVYVYINDNSGNYWGNFRANSKIAVGNNADSLGLNGADSDPCSLGTPLHTAAGYGNAANYVKIPAVAVAAGAITITVTEQGGEMGVAGIELVPASDIVLAQDVQPNYAETVAGDQVVFTAAFTNSPAVNVEWQSVSGGATNNVTGGIFTVTNNGVITSTLTLTNVQVTNSASYQLEAINAANHADVAFSSAALLVVGGLPRPTNNVIAAYAAQDGPSTFFPDWSINTNIDLIYGFQTTDSGPGTANAGVGNYGEDEANPDPTILVDGIPGVASNLLSQLNTFGPGGNSSGAAGTSMTYALITNDAPSGFDVTNIQVYGGWLNGNRDQQTYQVLYATVAQPTTFVPLTLENYLPADPTGSPASTRTTLTAATGVLARNVVAIEFNFAIASPYPENGYEGYSQIFVAGTPSAGVVPSLTNDVTPESALDVVGDQLVLTAGFSGYTSLQWQKNGTNIAGATSPMLTLNNLQVADAAAYSLVASNSAGTTSSHACVVTVEPVPPATNDIVIAIAGQTATYASFTPTWNPSQLSSSLLYGIPPSSVGSGDFTASFDNPPDGASEPSGLTDGTFGTIDFAESGNHASFTCAGSSAGTSVTYTLAGSTNGTSITNLAVYGGWSDAGRDQQSYTVYYATVAAPTNFLPLAEVDYLPVNPVGSSATRATITSQSGVLASNVVALYFDFTTPAGENGYEGYSEIAVYGTPSGPLVVVPPISSVSALGGKLIVAGAGGYPPNSGYTWLSTTNLASPVHWITNGTGTLDATGSFSNSIAINPSLPASFFQLRIP